MAALRTLQISSQLVRYDISMPLFDGRVAIDGFELKPVKASAMVFDDNPELREGRFDLWEINMGYFNPAIEQGWELIGLPIFPKRKPVYQFIFCRTDSGIDSPKDLEGKRIGTLQYRIVIDIWIRGILSEKYGVNLSRLHWIAQRQDVFPLLKPEIKIDHAEGGKNMVDRMLDGEVDSIITDISDEKLFNTLEGSPKVRRLFPNYIDEDKKLYEETGIFAPMHVIVMSKKLNQEHPELADKVYQAFEEAKRIAYSDILSDMAGFTVVNLRERMKEQLAGWGDPWKHGFKANRKTLETFNRYNFEQGLTRSNLTPEEMFVESTLET